MKGKLDVAIENHASKGVCVVEIRSLEEKPHELWTDKIQPIIDNMISNKQTVIIAFYDTVEKEIKEEITKILEQIEKIIEGYRFIVCDAYEVDSLMVNYIIK